jgi:hypothetical protein
VHRRVLLSFTMTSPRAILLLPATLLVLACAGEAPIDEGQTTTQGSGESDDEIGDETTTTGEDPNAELVVVVEVLEPFSTSREPGEGAVVALDTPQGRVEVVADAEGRAAFEDFAWSDQAVDITVGLSDCALRSHLGVVEADTEAGEFEITLTRNTVSDALVDLSGTAIGGDPAHDLLVYGSHATSYSGPGDDWSIQVAPDQPFRFVALEIDYLDAGARATDNPIFAWYTVEHPGVGEPTQIEIDFADPATPTSIQGSFAMPGRPESPLRTQTFGFLYAIELGGGPLVGRSITTAVSPDGSRCNFEFEHLEAASLESPLTCYRVLLPPDYEFSSTSCVPAWPMGGPEDIELIDTPDVSDVPGIRGLHDPIDFAIFDTGVRPNLFLSQAETSVWRVTAPLDATTLTVPEPPTGFAAPPGSMLDAQLSLFRIAASGDYNEASSTSQVFPVAVE